MVDALAGQRHGGTRTNGWGTGEARNSAKGESFLWMSREEMAMRTVPSNEGRRGSVAASGFSFYLCWAASASSLFFRVVPVLVKRVPRPWAEFVTGL